MKDKTIQLQLTPAQARQLYKSASADTKTILEASTSAGFFAGDARAILDACDDPYLGACKYLGIEPMDEADMRCNGFRQDEIDRRKLEVITFILNDEEYLDWNDQSTRKYSSYYDLSAPSGFAFSGTFYYFSIATAGYASRLCFKRDDDARYAGQHPKIAELYRSITINHPVEQ